MKVVHFNTSVNQSSAPYRLHEALCRKGVESKVLVLNSGAELEEVYQVKKKFFYKCKRKLYAFCRAKKMKKEKPVEYMPYTALPVGMDVRDIPMVKEADMICLHWVCGDFMSPKTIQKLLDTGKPVFMFCHDNYPFTGGCHVRLGCERYKEKCGCCPELQSQNMQDMSRKLAEEKSRRLQYPNLYVVSPSRWMDGNAAKSAVFGKQKHFVLPNAINTDIFHPFDKESARQEFGLSKEAFVVLAGLKANAKIPYNGTQYLWETLQNLYESRMNGIGNKRKLEIAVFGVETIEKDEKWGFPVYNVGYVREPERLAKLYSAADVYLITSLEDSFNQTAAECMACETPVTAFRNGGIEDIIDHKENGYLAEYKNTEDLLQGILWAESFEKRFTAREKVVSAFSYEKVSAKFLQIAEGLR